MKWTSVVKNEDGSYVIPKNWLFIHYYDALSILFRFENTLRIFVYSVLKNEYFDKWSDINVVSDDSNQGSINSLAKKRIGQAKAFGYLGYPINSPIMHLTSGELTRIITSDSYWKSFSKYFPMKKEIVRIKLDEIGTIRNSLAHFRPIQLDDVEVVKQNCKNILKDIQLYISEMLLLGSLVPSNCEDNWYKSLSKLKSDTCDLNYLQSKNGQWIKININFKTPIVDEKNHRDQHVNYQIFNLLTSELLKICPTISKYATFVSEQLPYSHRKKKLEVDFTKKIYINIHRTVLETNYQEIESDLGSLMNLVSDEILLITTDNYAKGKLLDLINTFAYLSEGEWNVNNSAFEMEGNENDPPEYWGQFPSFVGEFTRMYRFPWMPVDISNYDFFF